MNTATGNKHYPIRQHLLVAALGVTALAGCAVSATQDPTADDETALRWPAVTEAGLTGSPIQGEAIDPAVLAFVARTRTGADIAGRPERRFAGPTPTERVMEQADALRGRTFVAASASAPTEILTFTIISDFPEPNAGGTTASNLRSLNASIREPAMARRREQFTEVQRDIVVRLQNDPRVLEYEVSWLTGAIHVVADPAIVDELVTWPHVAQLTPNAPLQSQGAYDGWSLRQVTRADTLVGAGINGRPTSGGRVRVAIIDNAVQRSTESVVSSLRGWPLTQHAAFRESATDSNSRIVEGWDCNACSNNIFGICVGWGCSWRTAVAPRSDFVEHPTIFSWVLGGSVEEGQAYPVNDIWQQIGSTTNSGVAPEVRMDFFSARDCDALSRAMSRIRPDVNVIAIGVSIPSATCDPTYNCADVNQILARHLRNNVTVIAPVGAQWAGLCDVQYPSYRPEVIGVSAVETILGVSDQPFSTTISDYRTRPILVGAGDGRMPIRYVLPGAAPNEQTIPAVSVVAPGGVTRFPIATTAMNAFAEGNRTVSGTSFAAAAVAGGVALQYHALFNGSPPTWNVGMMANVLVSADGWNGRSGAEATFSATRGFSSGFGHYQALDPAVRPGSNPRGWGFRSLLLGEGTHRFSVGGGGAENGVRQWRWVVQMNAPDLWNITSDYVIAVVDTCHGDRLVGHDSGFDLRKRINLTQEEICPDGVCGCLEMRLNVLEGTAVFDMADFFHGGMVQL